MRARIAALVLTLLSVPVAAQQVSTEYRVKATYLFNFVKFVEWPADAPTDAIEFCFAGARGVHDAVAAAANKQIGSRRVVVRSLAAGEAPTRCAVVYLDASESGRQRVLLDAAGSTSLTIGDSPDFTRAGGVIRLFTRDNRLRFVVNVENARRAGLRVSSNLLKLASSVESEAAP
jgi:hypothetical protein